MSKPGHTHHNSSLNSDDWQKLLATHFGGSPPTPISTINAGPDDAVASTTEVSPLLKLTSDGTMLQELLETLHTGGEHPSGRIFSDETINAIMGEHFKEIAAEVIKSGADSGEPQQPALSSGVAVTQQQQQQQQNLLQNQGSTAGSMTLLEAQASMQAAHAVAMQQQQHVLIQQQQPVAQPMLATTGLQQPQYIATTTASATGQLQPTLLVQQQQPTMVMTQTADPTGQQQYLVHYVPVLESRVLGLPSAQVQVHNAAAVQQPAQSEDAMMLASTQQLMATAAAQQQQLQVQSINQAAPSLMRTTSDAAQAALAEAAAITAAVSAPLTSTAHVLNIATTTTGTPEQGTTPTSAQAHLQGLSLSPMHAQAIQNQPAQLLSRPPIFPQQSATAPGVIGAPTLIPQLRPATEPFPAATVPLAQPQLLPITTTTAPLPIDATLPSRPCHKRERSMKSDNPFLADPTTAPTEKSLRPSLDGIDDNGLPSPSPNSALLQDVLGLDSSSGDASPTAVDGGGPMDVGEPTNGHRMTRAAAARQLGTIHENNPAHQSQLSPVFVKPSTEPTEEMQEIIKAVLAPPPGKRRGRPPGSGRVIPAVAGATGAAIDPTDEDILHKLLDEDTSRMELPIEELKKLMRKEKNRISAAVSRHNTQVYTTHLEQEVKKLEQEHTWYVQRLEEDPQEPAHRTMLNQTEGIKPPLRHVSM